MRSTKRLALRHGGTSESIAEVPALRGGVMLFIALLLFMLGRPVQAQRLPLPADEQDAVNHAIDRGVEYLKRTQLGNGSWTMPKKPHEVGYAVLPGLTLLECGVPPNDRAIQRTARFLRAKAADLNTTYELSLGILFLDRLNSTDPKDKKIIQTFALRLIAGQSATGGWGYKCPGMKELPARMQMDLLTALRHLDPPPDKDMPLIAGDPAKQPGNMPGIANAPGKKPGDPALIAKVPGGQLEGGAAKEPGKPLSGSTTGPGESRYTPPTEAAEPSLFREWMGFSKTVPSIDVPAPPQKKDGGKDDKAREGNKDGNGKPAEGKDQPDEAKPAPKPAKPYILPDHLRVLTVIQDPELHVAQEPKDKRHDLIVTTTDNSNTQFAILALWTAQRHGVPMKRSLNLIVRRYVTSQNPNGTWGYDYRFGGGAGESPQMTCVGLIGLAVGHGLANQAGKPAKDPRILNGFVALSRHIGQPVDRLVNLPMQNLYYLWSLERVAVLYNLPKIGDKDWYRWGAQILVANQDQAGNWAGGQYPGNSPTLDTCLALLFLKRANLVKDLTAKLPFKPAELNDSVMEKLTPPAPPPPPSKPPEPIQKTTLPSEPVKPSEPDNLISKPIGELNGTTAAPTTAPEEETENSGRKKKWIAVVLVVFALLVVGGLIVFLILARRKKDEDGPVNKKGKGAKGKRKSRPLASQRDA